MLVVATLCCLAGSWQVIRFGEKHRANHELRHNNKDVLADVSTVLGPADQQISDGHAQQFRHVTMPLMKGAILVAVLFRSLDAFRIFDTIFIQTGGANRTESVSILGYNQLLNRLNLGIGSTISVLIFLCVVIISVIFVKGFGANLAQQRGEQ